MPKPSPVRLRCATSSDKDFLDALYASTRAHEVASWGWAAEAQAAFLRSQAQTQQRAYALQFPRAEHSIVEIAGRPAGRILVDMSENDIHLVDITLLPEQRGQGVGAALLADLLEQGRRQGRPVSLRVARTNRARVLYQRLGFREADGDPMTITMRWSPC